MHVVLQFFDIILHLNQHLGDILNQYGALAYGLLFLVVFCETGLVVMPFLPGDSLLFAAGSLFATSSLSVHLLVVLLMVATFLGDNCNYWCGRFIGPRAFQVKSRWFKQTYLLKAHAFYEKHGGKAIILGRFIPIVRTFIPFVAGLSKMPYRIFMAFSVLSTIIWINSLTFLGYFFGNIPVVKRNFSVVILVIVFISILPMLIECLRHLMRNKPRKAKG